MSETSAKRAKYAASTKKIIAQINASRNQISRAAAAKTRARNSAAKAAKKKKGGRR